MKKNALLVTALIVAIQLYSQKTYQLDECRQMALEHNKTLQISKETIKAADELKKAAFTQFLPNFSANAAYTWNEKNISLLGEDMYAPVYSYNSNGSVNYQNSWNNSWAKVGDNYVPLDANGSPFDPKSNPDKIEWKNKAYIPKDAFELDTKNIFVGTIGFTQPIFMGGKIRELYNISKAAENLAKASDEKSKTDLLLDVDEAYWRVVSLQNKVSLAIEYRNLIAKMDTDVADMVDEGLTTKAELLKVKVKLNEADVMLTKAENGLSLSKMALNQLCGLPLDTEYKLADTNLENGEDTKILPIEQALNNRPEIKELNESKNIALSNQKIAFSRFLPNVGLSANYLLSNPNAYNGYKNEFGGMFTVGVVANVPLFHFGDRIHTLNAAKAQVKIADLKIEETKEKMQLQIKQDSYKLIESIKKKDTARKNIEHAEENLKYASEGFKEGVITSTDLLGAQTAWLSAKSENIDALIDYRLCNLYLAKSQGITNTTK